LVVGASGWLLHWCWGAAELPQGRSRLPCGVVPDPITGTPMVVARGRHHTKRTVIHSATADRNIAGRYVQFLVLARDLPETPLHVTSRHLTPRILRASLTCAVV
jgi:hypothetical protein